MKIGLNATVIDDRPSGAKQRFVGLYGALIEASPEHEFIVYVPEGSEFANSFAEKGNCTVRPVKIDNSNRTLKYLSANRTWKRTLKEDRLDIIENYHFPPVFNPHGSTLLTIHDLRYLKNEYGALFRTAYKYGVKYFLNRVDAAIIVSDTILKDARSLHPKANLYRVYNGIESARFNSTTSDRGKAGPARADSNLILAVGHLEGRKNFDTLVRAAKLLKEREVPFKVKIVGNDSGEGANLRNLVEQLGLQDSCQFLSDLDDQEVIRLYSSASVFVFPSSYEGFGIPILEAMASGTPMALSELEIFHEIAGDSAIYFDTHDPGDLALKLQTLLEHPEQRAKLSTRGKARVKDFEFAHLAGQLKQIYRDIAPAAKR